MTSAPISRIFAIAESIAALTPGSIPSTWYSRAIPTLTHLRSDLFQIAGSSLVSAMSDVESRGSCPAVAS